MDQFVGDPAKLKDPPAGQQRRRFPRLTIIVLLALAGAGAWWWTHRQPAEHRREASGPRGEQAQSVGVATVGKGDIPVTYDGLGTVTSLATVTVKTQINGELIDVAFKEGQTVKKGDLLAQIDPRPYQVALEQAQGALVRDQASLANAQVDLARYQKLNLQNSIARQQVDTQQALVRQDQGTIQADQAQIDAAKLNLVYCRITSPVDGRVGLRQVDAGNYVQTSDANGIVVITQLQPISVIFTQPEDRLPAMTAKMKAGTPLTVSVYDRAFAKKIADGTVETIDNLIDTTTGTVKVRAIFPNTDDALFPNQFVNVRLLIDTLKDATVVPSAAVQIGAPGSFVYVVKDDDTVTVRKIKTGPAAVEHTAVLEGLQPGKRVVTDGVDRLHEGSKVRIPGASGDQGGGSDAKGGQADGAATGEASGGATGQHRHHHQDGDGASASSNTGGAAEGDAGNGRHRHHRRDGQTGEGQSDGPAATGPASTTNGTSPAGPGVAGPAGQSSSGGSPGSQPSP